MALVGHAHLFLWSHEFRKQKFHRNDASLVRINVVCVKESTKTGFLVRVYFVFLYTVILCKSS